MRLMDYNFICIDDECGEDHEIQIEITSAGHPGSGPTFEDPGSPPEAPEYAARIKHRQVTCACHLVYTEDYFNYNEEQVKAITERVEEHLQSMHDAAEEARAEEYYDRMRNDEPF
jgi:hypothetical protein